MSMLCAYVYVYIYIYISVYNSVFDYLYVYVTKVMVLLRLCQGLAVGGELVGAFIYTVESTKGINR